MLRIVLILVIAVSVTGNTVEETNRDVDTTDQIAALTAVEQWRSESLEHSAWVLALSEISCKRSIEKLLVELSTGERLVMLKERVPNEGLERLKLVEDGSGWWVLMTRDSELHLETRAPLDFARLPELLHAHRGEEWGIELSLTATDLPPFVMRSTTKEASFEHRFLSQFVHDGLAERFARGMPPEARSSVSFLKSMIESEHGQGSGFMGFQPLVLLLAEALDHQGGSNSAERFGSQKWLIVEEESRFVSKSTRLDEEQLLRQVEAFQTITTPGDPLEKIHLSAEDCS